MDISSVEEDKPRPASNRTSRKPRRSKPEEILEMLEEILAKHDLETESLERRCHELERVYARFVQRSPIDCFMSFSKLLGTR
jgi:hypothetical protein